MAALLRKAIGDQLSRVFVDNGLLRKNEGNRVMEMFAENMGANFLAQGTIYPDVIESAASSMWWRCGQWKAWTL